jgi:hypothetical protein
MADKENKDDTSKKKMRHSHASICALLQGKSMKHKIIPGLFYHGEYQYRPEIAGIVLPTGYDEHEESAKPLVESKIYIINGVVLPEYYVKDHPELKDYLIDTECDDCGQDPCWTETEEGDNILASVKSDFESDDSGLVTPKMCRHKCYKEFNRLIFGVGKKGERNDLPKCILASIRSVFPEPSGVYVGFREADKAK